ncbi:MAG TPA: cob(I)yrinic acid a,c-diamide adenosyltransferase [Desulfuromonadales bacterium]|jgi:cob(I)alamin adenosyltransferase
MVKLDRITTGTGDQGMTSLADGSRVAKASPRVGAYGTVDELNSLLGVVRAEGMPDDIDRELIRIQHDLFDLGADLATPIGGPAEEHIPRLRNDQVCRLEALIEAATAHLAPAESFVLPGGSRASAFLHLARTVARRAERAAVVLVETESAGGPEGTPPPVNTLCLKYLNRLSDLCFVWARRCNDSGRADVLWLPYHER